MSNADVGLNTTDGCTGLKVQELSIDPIVTAIEVKQNAASAQPCAMGWPHSETTTAKQRR